MWGCLVGLAPGQTLALYQTQGDALPKPPVVIPQVRDVVGSRMDVGGLTFAVPVGSPASLDTMRPENPSSIVVGLVGEMETPPAMERITKYATPVSSLVRKSVVGSARDV